MIYKHNKEQMQVINDLQTHDYTDTLSKRDPSNIDLFSRFFLETAGSTFQSRDCAVIKAYVPFERGDNRMIILGANFRLLRGIAKFVY